MAAKFTDYMKRLWNNYVFRNIVMAVSMFVILLFLASVLLNLFTRHNRYKDVPDFVGITLEEADRYARKDRLKIEVSDSLYVPAFEPGVILEQKPAMGTKVKSGRRIFVTVNSFRQKIVDVPYVAGYSLRQAKNILDASGLEIRKLIYVDDIATNNVLRQHIGSTEITAGVKAEAEMGTGVTLTVGRAPGAGRILTPSLVGMSVRDATSRVWESGLNYGEGIFEEDINTRNIRNARVWKQSPEQNTYSELGQEVRLWFSLDSLTIAEGIKASQAAASHTSRDRFITDSLSRAGYSGESLEAEKEWMLRLERGEALPGDRPRPAEDLLRESESYEREEVPLDELERSSGENEAGTGTEDDEFFF